jgi:thiamine-phosphate pyrophosphorylase
MSAQHFRLCLILTRSLCRRPPLDVLAESVRGGADLVQLREKECRTSDFAAWTTAALAAARALGVPLVVNDSVEIALACGADGVHLGQDDLEPTDARRLLGPHALIGWSTHDLAQLETAARLRPAVDYVGFGPAFPTGTQGYEKGLGAAQVRAAALRAGALGLPMLAIGGIRADNRAELGADVGIAVSAALCAAADPRVTASALLA